MFATSRQAAAALAFAILLAGGCRSEAPLACNDKSVTDAVIEAARKRMRQLGPIFDIQNSPIALIDVKSVRSEGQRSRCSASIRYDMKMAGNGADLSRSMGGAPSSMLKKTFEAKANKDIAYTVEKGENGHPAVAVDGLEGTI